MSEQDATQEHSSNPAAEAVDHQKDYGFESTSQETIESLMIPKPWVNQEAEVIEEAKADTQSADEKTDVPEAEVKDQPEDKDREGKKSRYQRRIDTIVSEREDIRIELERVKKENEALKSKQSEKKEVPVHEQPVKTQSDFDTYEEYLDYLEEYESAEPSDPVKKEFGDTHVVDKKDEKKPDEAPKDEAPEEPKVVLSVDQQKALARVKEAFSLADNKPQDFDAVVYGDVQISGPMLEAIAECDNPEKVAYHLGKNPELAKDIASRSVAQQMRSIAKLESDLSKPSRPQQKFTNAPPPIIPVGVTDNSVKPLHSISEYSEYEARRTEQKKKLEYNGGW